MSKIRAVQKPQLETIPKEQRSWFNDILLAYNDFISQAVKILNGGITFKDNFLGVEHVFDFVYQSDAISLPLGFTWTFATQPKALSVVSATEDNSPVNISVSWGYTEKGQVQLAGIVKFTSVPAVTTLVAASRYKIRVRVTP